MVPLFFYGKIFATLVFSRSFIESIKFLRYPILPKFPRDKKSLSADYFMLI